MIQSYEYVTLLLLEVILWSVVVPSYLDKYVLEDKPDLSRNEVTYSWEFNFNCGVPELEYVVIFDY